MSFHGERETGAAQAARAPAALVVDTQATDRAHGPCRDLPPLLSTVSAEVQGGVGGKARAARRPTGTEDGKDHGGHALFVEHDGGQGGPSSSALKKSRRGPASTSA